MSWETVRLGDVISTLKGFAFKSSHYTESGHPIVRASNFTMDSISADDLKYYSYEEALQYKKYSLKKSDVLIQTVGSWEYNPNSVVGKVVRVPEQLEGALLNQNIVKIMPNDAVDNIFLYYRLKCDDFSKYNIGNAVGAANQASITLDTIRDFTFECPEIIVQKHIANILSTYDDLIENNQKQIKLLEEASQRLYKEWFVDLHFPGYETTPIIDGVPEGWEWKPILDNDVFNFVKSRALPFEGEKTYYATADVSGTNVVSLGEKITFENKPSRAAIQPIPFSVWFARMINSYKILNCFGTNDWMVDKAILSSGFAGFTSRPEYYGFVYQTIASEYFDEEKNRYATGATQVSLTNDGLAKIQVLIPKIKIIRKYSERVYPIMYKAELLKNENIKLKEARDRLLPKLMSGEIEV